LGQALKQIEESKEQIGIKKLLVSKMAMGAMKQRSLSLRDRESYSNLGIDIWN